MTELRVNYNIEMFVIPRSDGRRLGEIILAAGRIFV